MKIVFFGTPEYVLPILDSLHKTFKTRASNSPIVAVVTQKPKPSGRKQILEYSPVDSWAHKKSIPKYFDAIDVFRNKVSAELGVVASYGAIIPKNVIDYFKYGIMNIHPSLLPKFRGASPVQATIVSGDKETGVTIIKIDEKVDHGPIISQFKEEVLPEDTTATLRKRLFEKSAEILTTLVPAFLSGKISPREQNHQEATITSLLKKDHGFIPSRYLRLAFKEQSFKGTWKIPFIQDYSLQPTTYNIYSFIRAMDPWPVAWTEIKIMVNGQWLKKRLKIIKTHLEELSINHQSLIIDIVQLEGKNPVSWEQFKEAYPNASL